jgi:hypothetical protein
MRMKWEGHVAHTRERRNAKLTEGKRSLVGHKRGWKYNIKMDFK